MATEFLDDVQTQHDRLEAAVHAADGEQTYWAEQLATLFWQALRNELELRNERAHIDLETAKGDDVKRLQAEIKARKELLAEIDLRASDARVAEAREALDAFRQQNGLFTEGLSNG